MLTRERKTFESFVAVLSHSAQVSKSKRTSNAITSGSRWPIYAYKGLMTAHGLLVRWSEIHAFHAAQTAVKDYILIHGVKRTLHSATNLHFCLTVKF